MHPRAAVTPMLPCSLRKRYRKRLVLAEPTQCPFVLGPTRTEMRNRVWVGFVVLQYGRQ